MYKTAWINTYNITANSICHFNMKKSLENQSTLCCKYPTASTKISNSRCLLTDDPGSQIPPEVATWLPEFDGFLLISSKLGQLYRFSHHQNLPTPRRFDPLSPTCTLRTQDSGVVEILPDFDGLLRISSKLDHLYIFSSHPTARVPVLTLCLPPAR